MAAELMSLYPGLFRSQEQARGLIRYHIKQASIEDSPTGEQSRWEEAVDTAIETFLAPNDCVTLEQALRLCRADLNVWEVEVDS